MAYAIKEEYYSGQGVVLVARRDPVTGKPMGYRPVGNCPSLTIAFETSTLEHKESTTGARGTDLRLTTENQCNLNFTLENFQAKNLADAIRGSSSSIAAATKTGELVAGYAGLVSALENIKVSAVTVDQDSQALTPYVDDETPWDYRLNTEAGSFILNDGKGVAMDEAGEAATGITVGATTSLAIASSTAVVGSKVVISGAAGADAALVNGIECTVLTNTGTAVTVDIVTTGRTITGTAARLFSQGTELSVDYTYAAQYQVDALTEGALELAMRFEGLNTAAENAPVIVEVFRFLTDPAQQLALIGDEIQNFVLEGSVLADTTRVTGSKFVRIKKLT